MTKSGIITILILLSITAVSFFQWKEWEKEWDTTYKMLYRNHIIDTIQKVALAKKKANTRKCSPWIIETPPVEIEKVVYRDRACPTQKTCYIKGNKPPVCY